MPSFLTRRVTFAAAHRYRRPDWSDERNAEVFGACARESFHGHSYTCDVVVTGDIDPVTGMIVDLGVLDHVLAAEVRDASTTATSTSTFRNLRTAALVSEPARITRALHLCARADGSWRPRDGWSA